MRQPLPLSRRGLSPGHSLFIAAPAEPWGNHWRERHALRFWKHRPKSHSLAAAVFRPDAASRLFCYSLVLHLQLRRPLPLPCPWLFDAPYVSSSASRLPNGSSNRTLCYKVSPSECVALKGDRFERANGKKSGAPVVIRTSRNPNVFGLLVL